MGADEGMRTTSIEDENQQEKTRKTEIETGKPEQVGLIQQGAPHQHPVSKGNPRENSPVPRI